MYQVPLLIAVGAALSALLNCHPDRMDALTSVPSTLGAGPESSHREKFRASQPGFLTAAIVDALDLAQFVVGTWAITLSTSAGGHVDDRRQVRFPASPPAASGLSVRHSFLIA